MRNLIQRFSGLFILLALSLFLAFSTEHFLTSGNLLNIVLQTSILAIVALGVGMTMLTAGIDLSVGSVAALCGAVDIKGGFTWPETLGERKLSMCEEVSLQHEKPIGADRFPDRKLPKDVGAFC